LKYSIDTSSILHAWRRAYPPEAFPSFWDKIHGLIDRGDLRASQTVFMDLERKDDEVLKWGKDHSDLFVPIDDEIQRVVSEIVGQFPGLVDVARTRSQADPFVIALAEIENCTVVTNELASGKPGKPKIPDVCRSLQIPCIPILELITREEWKF